jgi:hypothetical protein
VATFARSSEKQEFSKNMPKRIASDPTAFKKLGELIKEHEASGRTRSAAFLIWFLQTVYRLDTVAAQDSVCDRKADMGIDALSVDDDQSEVVLFQAKRRESLPATLGDADLRQFVGSIKQFQTRESIDRIATETSNMELRNLLLNNRIAEKIASGYKIRPIFIANVAADKNARAYLKSASAGGVIIDLWDLERLTPILNQLAKEWFVQTPITLKLAPNKCFAQGERGNPGLVFASVPALELVRLPGIDDTRVFAQNVRLGLGKTRVNNEIFESVKRKSEHGQFLTFHNGLTIVAKNLRLRGNKLAMSRYSVCNGCQSLLTFYNNRSLLTSDLEILVRFVKVGDDRKGAEAIAYRTNNQNAISLRDLSANDSTQIQLKAEYDNLFGDRSVYTIKRGEAVAGAELHNEYAGQLLLAFNIRQPWSAHQKYKVFGELEGEIFRYGVTAAHIRLVQTIADEVDDLIHGIENERIQKYGLTKFLIVYLIGEALRLEEDGKILLRDPLPYLRTKQSNPKAQKREARVVKQIRELINFVITELNYFIADQGGDAYDYKSEFKSPKQVGLIRTEIIKAYEKDKFRKRLASFKLPS